MCWERQFCACYQPPWARNTFLARDRQSCPRLCWTYYLVWECLSLFQTECVLLCSVYVSYGTWSTPLLYVFCGERMKFFILWHKRGMYKPMALHHQLLALGDQCPLLKLILLCFFSIVKCCSGQCSTALCLHW